MEEYEELKLILKNKIYLVPSNFHSLNDIDQLIYSELMTKKQYKIKSNIHEEILQSFIQNWITMEAPFINENNISEYEKLSKEFNRMKNIIEIYHKLNPKKQYLEDENNKLKRRLIEKNDIYKQKISKYQQIISSLFGKNGLDQESKFLNLKQNLYLSWKNGNFQLVELYTQKFIKENELVFVLKEDDNTACLFQGKKANKDILIPKSVQYESKDFIIKSFYENSFRLSQSIKNIHFSIDSELSFIGKCSFTNSFLESIIIPKSVTHIGERAFSNCAKLKKVEFVEPSKLKFFSKELFYNSTIRCVHIPSSIESLEDRWCCATRYLKSIIISPKSSLFSLMDNSIVIKKFCEKSDNYNVICFAKRDIQSITIPSFIERISPYSFEYCTELKTVNFPFDSNLRFIEKYAFAQSSIESITIPSHVEQIGDKAFSSCINLSNIKIPENSELKVIGKSAFNGTIIEDIAIPSSIEELKEDWCVSTYKLNHITIIENKIENIRYFNDCFLLGKSNNDSDFFDVLLFARRDIEIAVIPSFIRRIDSNAFYGCYKLEKVLFSDDSELITIGKRAFYSSGLKCISIPPHVIQIEDYAFAFCNKIKEFKFSDNSELLSIGSIAFSNSSLCEIKIPKTVTQIGESAFYLCKKLKKIDFDANSELQKIYQYALSCCSIESLSIPLNVNFIGKCAFFSCLELQVVEILSYSQSCLISNVLFFGSTNVAIFTPCKLLS